MEPGRIDCIYWEAAQIVSEEERAAYLDRVCGADSRLHQRVVQLLKVRAAADNLLEAPAVLAALDEPIGEKPGTVIGPYKLLEQIGEGGMGLVFMAEQTQPVKRRVALKVLKPGMDTNQVVARFEAERQALALMDHPNIARVFDGGATDAGRPYFVMELVRGVPITEFCDQHRLTTRQRLELFVTVCQAVQHAHQKGIIHRDLKPTNVLVTLNDTIAVPKVIDFGVAKATTGPLTERTLFTHFAQLIGTPLYMSPEQAEMNALDVDVRSDVYALGVVLYELLTGTTPFTNETLRRVGLDELRRIIREEEPPTPSQRLSTLDAQACSTVSQRRGVDGRRLSQVVRGELDWIVMRALEKDRNRRYESASALAADVRLYLNDEAVSACPPSAGYRLRKFTRRHRGALTTAVLFLFAVLTGTGLSIWQAIRATEAQELAEANSRAAVAQQQRAEQHLRVAQEVVGILTDVGQERLKYIPRVDPIRRELLEKALAYYQQFAEQESADPRMRGEVGKAYIRVAMILDDFGEDPKAIAAIRQAVNVFEKLRLEVADEPEYQNDLARALSLLGYWTRDRLPEAKQALGEAIATQEQLTVAFPERPAYRADLIDSYMRYAHILMYNPIAVDYKEAEKAVRQALALAPTAPPSYRQWADTIPGFLGDLCRETGRLEEAEKIWRQDLARYQHQAREQPSDFWCRLQIAHRHENLGWLLETEERLPEAEKAYREATAVREKLVADFPTLADLQHLQNRSRYSLARVLWSMGRLRDSLELYRQGVAQEKKFLAAFPASAEFQLDLAWSLIANPDPAAREPAYALELARKAVAAGGQGAPGWTALGIAHYRVGDWKAAEAALTTSLGAGPDEKHACVDRLFLAMVHWRMGNTGQAQELYREATQWIALKRSYNGRVKQFQAEAAELMKAAQAPPPEADQPPRMP